MQPKFRPTSRLFAMISTCNKNTKHYAVYVIQPQVKYWEHMYRGESDKWREWVREKRENRRDWNNSQAINTFISLFVCDSYWQKFACSGIETGFTKVQLWRYRSYTCIDHVPHKPKNSNIINNAFTIECKNKVFEHSYIITPYGYVAIPFLSFSHISSVKTTLDALTE